MKLVLYSGGDIRDNELLDFEILRLTGKHNPSCTMIPSSFEEAHFYFEDFVDSFSEYGVNDFMLFPIDMKFNSKILNKAFSRDVIYLSGGNTFYFLHHLRKTGLLRLLREYVRKGGVLAGMSAGSILMTSNVDTAGFPSHDCDENEIGIKNFKAMNLVNFEFFPHFLNSSQYIEPLQAYSKTIDRPIYACPDGSGISVEDDKIHFIGRVWCFFNGHKFKVSN